LPDYKIEGQGRHPDSFNPLDKGQVDGLLRLHLNATTFSHARAMTALLLTQQLLNFVAPAAFVALFVVLLARVFARFLGSKRPLPLSFWAQTAIVFVASAFVLLAGLVIFGRDGKMATYAALAVGAATCQWVLMRGWKA
jgi:hypothetical protein